jgi:hypothetical protein
MPSYLLDIRLDIWLFSVSGWISGASLDIRPSVINIGTYFITLSYLDRLQIFEHSVIISPPMDEIPGGQPRVGWRVVITS